MSIPQLLINIIPTQGKMMAQWETFATFSVTPSEVSSVD